jgi:hypothetical protein
MLWTVFKIFMVVWMLQMIFRFGGSAIQVVLVVSFAALLLRWASLVRLSRKAGCASPQRPEGSTPPYTEQFAGDSKTNSSLYNRT